MNISVFDGDNVVARVENNTNLDFWDGHNWSCGEIGHHLGLTKLRDGRFVLIHGSGYEGERDFGVIVSDSEALQAALNSGDDLIVNKFFPGKLKELDDMEELER